MRGMAERVWKVSELIRQINVELFRYNDISVEGEATNVVRSAAVIAYERRLDRISAAAIEAKDKGRADAHPTRHHVIFVAG